MVLVASYDLLDLLGGLFADVRKLVQLSAAWLVVNTGPGGSGGDEWGGIELVDYLALHHTKWFWKILVIFVSTLLSIIQVWNIHFDPMFLLYPISW